MTQIQYINRTIRALCGDSPARPDLYHNVVRMTGSLHGVYDFDKPNEFSNNLSPQGDLKNEQQ